MRYAYEVFNSGARTDTGTDHSLYKLMLAPGESVLITDQLKNESELYINNDELQQFLDASAMCAQWGRNVHKTDRLDKIEAVVSSMQKQPYDALAETDGFHVAPSASRMTLGELKLGKLKLEDANVKTAAAAKKPRTAAVPPIAIMALGAAMQTGADKYGLFNWRGTSVTATVFYNALLRHLEQWYSGEKCASDTGVHHLAHLMAGAAIILDAEMNGVFVDDRPRGTPLGDDYEKYYKEPPK